MNTSPISKDKLNFLNNLLDKELEQLKAPDQHIFQKSQPSTQIDHEPYHFHQSSVRALSNNTQTRFPATTSLTTQINNSRNNNNNSNELSDLQDKIFSLENQIKGNVGKQGMQKGDSDDDTPMKNKYGQGNSNRKKIQFNDQRTKRISPDKELERQNKFRLERSIESAENKLSQSKATYRKTLNQSQVKSKSRDKSVRNLSGNIQNEKDVGILQNKVQQMRKQMEEDKSLLLKEKQKNGLLQQQIDQLNKKLKKTQQNNEKQVEMEKEQQRLLENFEKSEYIRQQQKTLIQALKGELEELKSGKHKEDIQLKSNGKGKKKKKVLEENNRHLNK